MVEQRLTGDVAGVQPAPTECSKGPIERRSGLMSDIGRRGLMRAALGGLGLAVAPAQLWAATRDTVAAPLKGADHRRELLAVLSEMVIPATDTPGAADVGVPAFVEVALAHGLLGTHADAAAGAGQGDWLGRVRAELDARTGGSFMKAPPQAREAALIALDAEAFGPNGAAAPWRKIKGLILIGYYTSEIGASHELRYELTPGHWDPDVPLTPDMRAFSSDWTAVDFG